MVCPACGSGSPNPECWHCKSTVSEAQVEAALPLVQADLNAVITAPPVPTPPTPRSRPVLLRQGYIPPRYRGPRKACPRCHEMTGMATEVCMCGHRYLPQGPGVRRL